MVFRDEVVFEEVQKSGFQRDEVVLERSKRVVFRVKLDSEGQARVGKFRCLQGQKSRGL